MAQILKHEIKNRILEAALNIFSVKGFKSSSMAEVAQAAGISTGNIYRYFSDKEALFYEALPEKLSIFLKESLRKKIAIWNGTNLDSQSHQLKQGQEELISLMLDYRRQWVILLQNAQGTSYEDLTEELTDHLADLFMQYLISIDQKEKTDSLIFRKTVNLLYHNVIMTFSSFLGSELDNENIRSAMSLYLQYHIAGIREICQ